MVLCLTINASLDSHNERRKRMTGDKQLWEDAGVCARAYLIHVGLCHSPRAPVILSALRKLILFYQAHLRGILAWAYIQENLCFCWVRDIHLTVRTKYTVGKTTFLRSCWQPETLRLNTRVHSLPSRSKFHSYPYFSLLPIYMLFHSLYIFENHPRILFSLKHCHI